MKSLIVRVGALCAMVAAGCGDASITDGTGTGGEFGAGGDIDETEGDRLASVTKAALLQKRETEAAEAASPEPPAKEKLKKTKLKEETEEMSAAEELAKIKKERQHAAEKQAVQIDPANDDDFAKGSTGSMQRSKVMCEEFYGVVACLRGACAGSIRKLVVLITAVIIMFGIGP